MPAQSLFGPGKMLITGGTFTQINQSASEHGFNALSDKISHGAMYDSAERYGAGRCHPGTREEIISMILEWVNNPTPERDVLWLWGPAGAGKSSILQTVSELLVQSHRARYGGSFFFAKCVPGRGDGRTLFSTLAYQVACNVNGMRQAVNEAMTTDPLLPSKNMATQFHSLILQPLLDLPAAPQHSPTIIIDGLDECQGIDDQRAILTLIMKSLTASRRVPLRFVIASRPEYAIRGEFDRPFLSVLTERIELAHSRKTSEDIRKYLQDGFDEIYERNFDVMGEVEKPWPPVDRVNMFVRNASGQFVYASTVLRFIGSYSDYSDPQSQLDVISKPGPSRAEAFSPLDHLYITILSNYPRREELMKVLGGLLVKASLSTIVYCLNVTPSGLKMVLRAISSLIKYPRSRVNVDNKELETVFGPLDQNPIAFAHLSFRDFLQDKVRSGEFWVDTKDVYSKLYHKSMDTFVDQLTIHKDADKSLSTIRDVIPIAYDDFWGVYSYSTIPKNTPSPIVTKRLFDLQAVLKAFLHGFDDAVASPSRLKNLSQTMQVAYKYLTSLKEFLTMNASFTEETHKDLVSQTRRVIDLCFQRTISVEHFIDIPNAPIFILGGSGFMTLETIVGCLDTPHESAIDFLKDNRHLIECDSQLIYYREEKMDELTRSYSCLPLARGFLMSEKRSGVLHRSFRNAAIKTWRELVVKLVKISDKPLSEATHSFISEFLTRKTLIRLVNKSDLQFMTPLFTQLCELDWSTLELADREGGEEIFLTGFNILRFLHGTLSNLQSTTLMTPQFRSTITTAMERMYEALIMRPTSTNYFSEDSLLSDEKVVGIPPHNINPADSQYDRGYEDGLTDNLDYLKEMLQETKYKISIDPATVCTSVLEFLLRVWTTTFYKDSECPLGTIIGTRCQFLFSHARLSEKIRLALLTLRDLDSKCRLKPNLPISIVISAQGFLLRHRAAMDVDNDLLTWLDELQGRSAARKEKYPDSDVPSDLESIEDNDSDLTDISHDDDHGYDLDDDEKEDQDTLGQEEGDFGSIYAWGDS